MMIRVPLAELQQEFRRVLSLAGFNARNAELCATIFANNTLDGVVSHGINFFPEFVRMVKAGHVQAGAAPAKVNGFGAWEQWDGNLGPGPLNAWHCTEIAMALARQFGMGGVSLRNTNHWMRGGTYGWKAAEAGFILICWTNTRPNLPPWGSAQPVLGNNPLVIAVPRAEGHIVLDMAMSQFSYGKISAFSKVHKKLPVYGGYNKHGALTQEPAEILETQRALPVGYWKGAGLALVLDLLAGILSGGKFTHAIGTSGVESGISQVFMAFDPAKFQALPSVHAAVAEVIANLHAAAPLSEHTPIRYPGEQALKNREENKRHGVPVHEDAWQTLQQLER